MNARGAQWYGGISILQYTSLKIEVLLHKTALVNFPMATTVNSYIALKLKFRPSSFCYSHISKPYNVFHGISFRIFACTSMKGFFSNLVLHKFQRILFESFTCMTFKQFFLNLLISKVFCFECFMCTSF